MASTISETELSSITFRSQIEAYRAQYDQQSMSPTMALITVVADVLDVDPLDVDPLYEAIDTDALNNVLQSGSAGDDPLRVSFTFSSCNVTMTSDGYVEVAPMDAEPMEEAPMEETPIEEARPDEPRPDDTRADNSGADGVRANGAKPNQARPDEAGADGVRADGVQPDEAQTDVDSR